MAEKKCTDNEFPKTFTPPEMKDCKKADLFLEQVCNVGKGSDDGCTKGSHS
jgi:hypothetical protein